VALSADQQAMLQLLLERGQSYGDLAAVLGVDESEVRARARAALTELAGADPDGTVGLTDYLLGQADPIGRADAVRHLKEDPEDLALAGELAQKLLLVAPEAQLPRLPGEERRPRPRGPRPPALARLPLPARLRRRRRPEGGPPEGPSAPHARTTLSRRQTQILVALGSGAVLLVAVVLGIAGAFGGGSSEGTTTTPGSGSSERRTQVDLESPRGGRASGTAVFGVASSQPYVEVSLSDLDPAPRGQAYVVWLLFTGDQGFPLQPFAVSRDGTFQDRIPIPSALLPLIVRVRFVDVSIAPTDEIRKAVQSAVSKTNIVIKRPGTTVLRGAIPKSGQRGS
jgi:hypothetical protein